MATPNSKLDARSSKLAALLLCCLTLLTSSALAADPAGKANDPGAIDPARALEQARQLVNAGRLVEAEKLLGQVLTAIDAGREPKSSLGRCLLPLTEIYSAWGQNEDALRTGLRYRKFLEEAKLDQQDRDQKLAENAVKVADILVAIGRHEEAESYLQKATVFFEQQSARNPVPLLGLEVKLARLADVQQDQPKSSERWSRVVDDAQSAVKRIENRELPADYRADCIRALSNGYVAQENYAEAIRAQQHLLKVEEQRKDPAAQVRIRLDIGNLLVETRDYPAAQQYLADALAIQRKLPADLSRTAEVLTRLAANGQARGEQGEARKLYGEAAAMYAKALGQAVRDEHSTPLAMNLLSQLQAVYQQTGQFQKAIVAGGQLLELRRKRLGNEHPQTYAAMSDLGALYGVVEDFEAAKPLLTDALAHWRRHQPAAPLDVARALNDLGVVERATGSFSQAQVLFDEALAIRQKQLKPDDLRLAYSASNLASVLLAKGEYARAVVLIDQAIEIYRRRGRSAADSLSTALLNAAMAFKSQGLLDRSAKYTRESLQVYEEIFGADAPGTVAHWNALAALAIAQGRLDEAAQVNQRALDIIGRHKLNRDPAAATAKHHRATIEYLRNDLDAAEKHWLEALDIQQAAGQTPLEARTLNYLAKLATLKGHPDEAEPLYRKAFALQQTVQAYPTVRYLTHCNLAEILHEQGKTDEAIALVEQAASIIETPRAGSVGAEGERADYFAQFASAFDLLVAWNLQADHVEEAFAFAERGRNRTFLDQLSLAGVDLRSTLTGPAGEKLLERERSLRTRLGTLRGRALNAVDGPKSKQPLAEMKQELDKLESEYAQVWNEIRGASPLYRQQLARGTAIVSLPKIREQLQKTNSWMLFYYLGTKESHLLVIGSTDQKVEVYPLEVPAALAEGMAVPPGPLTRAAAVQLVSQYLSDVRDRSGGRGLAGIVKSPKGVQAADQGTHLAEVLLPRAVRQMITKAAPQNVVIVPDGALHQLPFEALLLESEPAPRYLLDVFPPISYAPSATILANLEQRPAVDSAAEVSLLTVGNPQYGTPKREAAEISLIAASRDAFLELGGQLPPLPATARECAQIAAAFKGREIKLLTGADATEANVRRALTGQRFIHLATHGLVDQRHDNLFGAVALAAPPKPSNSTEDDGFLSLHEIHALDLSGCELAVLSACQTNVGPDRPLEAGSTLAQAFLAAGARRVVSSHWNVDDVSTAELMGQFFTRVSKGLNDKGGVDYAAALHESQKAIRASSKWSAPYYWAPFVLIGPAR